MSGSPAELQHMLTCNKNINFLEAAETSPHIFACLIFCNVSKTNEVICRGIVGTELAPN